MDFRISADDRVGAPSQKGKAQPRAAKGSQRVEPSMGRAAGVFIDDERSGGVPPAGGGGGGRGGNKKPPRAEKPRRGKAEAAKAKPKRRRSRTGGFLMTLLWWGFVACLWGGIAVIG